MYKEELEILVKLYEEVTKIPRDTIEFIRDYRQLSESDQKTILATVLSMADKRPKSIRRGGKPKTTTNHLTADAREGRGDDMRKIRCLDCKRLSEIEVDIDEIETFPHRQEFKCLHCGKYMILTIDLVNAIKVTTEKVGYVNHLTADAREKYETE